jgi:carboxypeptidase C (cathepsin A)
LHGQPVVVLCVVELHADDTKTAKGMLDFMLAWYERFPQFKSNKLFLAGQSYAGARIFFK